MSRETSVVRGALKAVSDENTGMAIAEVGGSVVVTMLAGKGNVWVTIRRSVSASQCVGASHRGDLVRLSVTAPPKPWMPVEFSFSTVTDSGEDEVFHRNAITVVPAAPVEQPAEPNEIKHSVVVPWPRKTDSD